MAEHGVAHDREAESRAAAVARASFRDAIEPLEEARQMLLGYAAARVAEREIEKIFVLVVAFCTHLRTLPGVADAVFHKIAENSVDEGIVAREHRGRGNELLETHACLLHAAAQFVGNVFHHAAHVDCLERQSLGRFFRFRYQGHVAYEVGEPHRLRVAFRRSRPCAVRSAPHIP